MYKKMSSKTGLVFKLLRTDLTKVILLSQVSKFMSIEIRFRREVLLTSLALKRLTTTVYMKMFFEIESSIETFRTFRTSMTLLP